MCRKKVTYVKEPRCARCGKPVRYEEQEYCHDCQGQHFFYDQGRSLWLHKEPVKQSVYRFKYHNKRVYARTYARELFQLYEKTLEEWRPDVLIPVPLHRRRRRRRGYNQAMVLAKELGKLTHIPVHSELVRRCRYTNPQKKLDKRQRSRNLKDAFVIKGNVEGIRSVLIVDDIYTTGSTIHAIAGKLKEKGIQKVWFLTISIGQGF